MIFYWGYDTAKEDLTYADRLAEKYEIILVGPWSHCLSPLLYTQNIRYVTFGEFEHTVLEIVKGHHIFEIKGLSWRNHINKEIIINETRPLCSTKELDEIPFVTDVYRRNLDFRNYRQTSFRYPFTDLLGSRGCPYRCSYCLWVNAFQGGPSYRSRSISNVMEELWFIHDKIPEIKQIHFQDDTLPEKRMKELSQSILDQDLNITWSGYTRAEITRDTLELFKHSGGRTLHVGYESANQSTLNIVNKNITVERMEQFAKDVQDLSIWTCGGFMIFPWETKADVRNTIKWAKKVIKPRRFSFTQLFAYPNTPIEKTLQTLCKFNIYDSSDHSCLTLKEMTELEKEGFREYYLKNPLWWCDVLKHPREIMNVVRDGFGLLDFLLEDSR